MASILVIAPHCSTGGLPAYVLAYLEGMQAHGHDVHFSEFANISDSYTVQRDKIRSRFPWTCHSGCDQSLLLTINKGFDAIHFQENPLTFLQPKTLSKILMGRSNYKLFLTSHDVFLNYSGLPFQADRYVAVCEWQATQIREQVRASDVKVAAYPITKIRPSIIAKDKAKSHLGFDSNKKHLLQVGLWHPNKNQTWTIDASQYLPTDWHIHFIGNQAPNFKEYWANIEIPDNCTVWGERADVDVFMRAADAFVMPSKYELAPISLKEAIGAGIDCYVSPLKVYKGHEYDSIKYIDLGDPKSLLQSIQ